MRYTLWLHVAAISLTLPSDRLESQRPPAGPPPGALFDVGGHKLHLRCIGPADAKPVVILEAGAGAFSTAWSLVQDELSARVRTCAYDRAGFGWSERGPSPRTMQQQVFELHALLDAATLRGPFVFVGHSMGGMLARLYADQHNEQVAGVVLVDAPHESDVLGSVKYGGWVRLREKATDRQVPKPRRDDEQGTAPDSTDDYVFEEFQQMYLARKSNPQPLGKRPLIVLAAGRRPAPPGTSAELWEQLRVEKDGQKIDLSRLSSNSRFVLDPSSTHQIHRDNPKLVARAIQEVLAAVASGAPFVP